MQSLGQLIGMLLLNPISDRIGRKVTLYVLWVLLVVQDSDPLNFRVPVLTQWAFLWIMLPIFL